MPFITTALGVGLGLAGVGAGIAGSKMQSGAAHDAANLQQSEAQQSLDFQKQQFATQQANQAPWLKAGQAAIGQLSSEVMPGGDLSKGWQGGDFQAPTNVTEQNDPGFQFRLQQGQDALQNSAAARGGLLTGGTAKALSDYNQNAASAEYGNVYNRAFNNFSSKYNIWNNDQSTKYNRLAGLAGVGQTSAQNLGMLGQNAANNVSNTLLTSGQQIGNDWQNAAFQTASGYAGAANSLNAGLTNYSQLSYLNGLMNRQNAGNTATNIGGANYYDPTNFGAGIGAGG